MLVASAGGHLQQLVWLAPWWRRHDRVWITFDTPDARGMLPGERIRFAHHPTNRNARNALRNARLARTALREDAPDLIVSTGAAVAVPFFVAAAIRRIPAVFIEPYDRVDGPSLTGRLVRPLASSVVLQRREQLAFYPSGILIGPVR